MKSLTQCCAHALDRLHHGLPGVCAVIFCILLMLAACSSDPGHEPKPIPGSPTDVSGGQNSDASPDKPDTPADGDTPWKGDDSSSADGHPAAVTPRGDGSYADPYNVAFINAERSVWSDVWVEGYVVGYFASGGFPAGARCGAWNEADVAYDDANLLLADSPAEMNPDFMMPVMLTGPYAAQYGLRGNPSRIGIRIRIRCAIGPLSRPVLSQQDAVIPAALGLTALIAQID